jgi:hypothetical protein
MADVLYLYCLDFPNGKKYIGLTSNLAARRKGYRAQVKSGRLRYPVLAAIRKYGLPDLRPLCKGNTRYICELEIRAIAHFRTRECAFGYNVTLGGQLSPTVTPEVAAKRSATVTGRKLSPEHCAAVSAGLTGRKASPEHCAAMSAARLGKKQSPETRVKKSAALKGRKKSAEWRAKISGAHKASPAAQAARLATAAARKGRKLSPEHVANLRIAWQLHKFADTLTILLLGDRNLLSTVE